ELLEALLAVHREVQGLLHRGRAPVGVVVLARTGVDEDLDLPIAGDVGERVRHLVVRLPVPHQTSPVGVALHEQNALVAELELVVVVPILVLGKSRSLGHGTLLSQQGSHPDDRFRKRSTFPRRSSVSNDSVSAAIAKSMVASTARSTCRFRTRLVASTACRGS